VDVKVEPEPSDDELRAILAALSETPGAAAAYTSRWRASALDDLRGDPVAEEPGGNPRVVEP
jgi:hypothetical protein